MKRSKRFENAVKFLGSLVSGGVKPKTGWPGLLKVKVDGSAVATALHVSTVSSHARSPHELRFQNPGDRSPVSDDGGSAVPVLLGIDDSAKPEVFVAIDGRSRVGRDARFSILFHKRIIAQARLKGWAVYESNTGENIYAFYPSLFPVFLAQITAKAPLPAEAVVEAGQAAGLLDSLDNEKATSEAAERTTRAVTILVRRAGLGRKIRNAYDGACALCGIGSNLLAGAHIFPVEAAGSQDQVWNGISLCLNHHSAFDQHLIWINPTTLKVVLHPELLKTAKTNAGTKHFVDSTMQTLSLPKLAAHRPRAEMFHARYQYYSGKYVWLK